MVLYLHIIVLEVYHNVNVGRGDDGDTDYAFNLPELLNFNTQMQLLNHTSWNNKDSCLTMETFDRFLLQYFSLYPYKLSALHKNNPLKR